jgi:integrase/recombinase XerC
MDPVLQFLNERSANIRTKVSRDRYRNTLDQLHRWAGKPLFQLTERDLEEFLRHGNPAPNTVASRRSIIRGFYLWAHRAEYVHANPAADLPTVRAKNVRARHWLTADQARQAIAAAGGGPFPLRDRALVGVLVYTGLRAQEAGQLRWDDIDLATNRIRVKGKGEKHAVVGIAADLHQLLTDWKQVHGTGWVFPRGRYAGVGGRADHWLDYDVPLAPQGIRIVVTRVGKLIGVPGLRPHDLRRTLAGILEDRQVPIDQISAVLRHSTVATTQRYLQDNPAKGVEALQGFSL